VNPSRWALRVAFVTIVLVSAAAADATEHADSGSLPSPRRRELPTYPDSAWRANLEGVVIVRVLLDINGGIERSEIAKSAPAFDRAALAAVAKFAFPPARDAEGQPHRVWVRVPFEFRLPKVDDDPRVCSDTLWINPWSSAPAVMQQQRETILRMIQDAQEVWLFRLDPGSEGGATPEAPRSRFARRAILEEARVGDKPTLAALRTLLGDARTHATPPRLKCEYEPRLGVRFVSKGKVLDVAVSFCDQAIFLKDGSRLWAGSAYAHVNEWARLAHAAFPADPNFGRYATMDFQAR